MLTLWLCYMSRLFTKNLWLQPPGVHIAKRSLNFVTRFLAPLVMFVIFFTQKCIWLSCFKHFPFCFVTMSISEAKLA